MNIPNLFGILNITSDSFSDGGNYLDSRAAIDRGIKLISEGADTIDLGAQSSNPDAKILNWEEEWNRLLPVWDGFKGFNSISGKQVEISIDSYKPEILERAWDRGLDYWNDITALSNPYMENIIRNHKFTESKNFPKFIVMFSHNRGQIAVKNSLLKPESIVPMILEFFQREKERWLSWGIPEDKIIYDPGMGFFLGEDSNLSLEVLRNIPRFKKELGKILVSVSRKSFLGNSLGGRPPLERRYASFAAELYLAEQGVDCIRTHEITPLRDMIRIRGKIKGMSVLLY